MQAIGTDPESVAVQALDSFGLKNSLVMHKKTCCFILICKVHRNTMSVPILGEDST